MPTLSTDVYWDVEGTALQTFAYNIESWGASRETPPPPRGANVIVQGRPGQQYQPKMPDSRIITLSMWVIGSNPDGSMPSDGNMRALFEYNYKMLRALLSNPYRQFQLTKRFKEYGSATVVSATALAEFSGGLDLQMTGELRGIFTVDLLLADPYFYETAVTSPALTATPTPYTLTGDARSYRVTANIAGARTNPQIQIATPKFSVWAQLNDTILGGETANMDSYAMKALHNTSVVSSKVSHAGSPMWLFVEPGVNNFSVTSTSGAGAVTLSYQKAHL